MFSFSFICFRGRVISIASLDALDALVCLDGRTASIACVSRGSSSSLLI